VFVEFTDAMVNELFTMRFGLLYFIVNILLEKYEKKICIDTMDIVFSSPAILAHPQLHLCGIGWQGTQVFLA
jgi:hypothetical protein